MTCVLFDFDGPLADLFAHRPAVRVAETLGRRAQKLGVPAGVVRGVRDPLLVLRKAAWHGAVNVIRELQELLAEEETKAARSARLTPHADGLVRSLAASGREVAVTTNNSARAATVFLKERGLSRFFGPHIHGRAPDPTLLKPDPDCLTRAMTSTGTEPAECLMIGDSVSDLEAADKAGVSFVGYARAPHKTVALRNAGAIHVVGSLEVLVDMVRHQDSHSVQCAGSG
ncbi:HAD family hydrolase [Streptomyces sp. MI02-7b]|uniref:HAD family hydrolase n=1 Tax=Streptomyces sp. MI02-7b TaxID=462941 RepID=UPI0029BC44A2|nr:HAD family hydrolase [Streptomyces sp. MI02-7b]MDX3076504.1 HAD family hydrolase [Streptomyces sp. MI02-7b]